MSFELQQITQQKQHQQILKQIDLTIPEQQILAILGPSGSGKTTLLRILGGLDQPTSGVFLHRGQPAAPGILVFQDYRLFPFLTVADNVAFGLKMQHVARQERDQRVTTMLAQLNITELAQRYPSEISGGQQQRVALARALVLAPQLLLLDEPFSSLDEALRLEMLQLVQRLQQTLHLTVVFVTHYKTEAYLMAQQVAILIDGQIRQVATPEQLDQTPQGLTVAQFLGHANFITGRWQQQRFHSALYTGVAQATPMVAENATLYVPYAGLLTVMPTKWRAFTGTVCSCQWNGQTYFYQLQVQSETLWVLLPQKLALGQTTTFYFEKEPLVY